MVIGYARVSVAAATRDQTMQHQLDALASAGCEIIFQEIVSGIKADRPEFEKMLNQLQKGDIVCIFKLDRLGLPLKKFLELVTDFHGREIGLRSLTDSIDTTLPNASLVLNVFSSLAELERDLVRERTGAGLQAARARGKKGGRRSGLSPEARKKSMLAEMYYKEGKLGVDQIAKTVGVSKMTLYKYLRLRGVAISAYQSQTE
ncbi:recombinase family protein [Dyadobacter sp. NIV53]|uniref:recombinase family protein n=1 Tax=Dyadobacter sp. NIV53 TaxID=2861765 RepID=UPI001C88C79C|nr:recombinase family protein [Dyadobacter sp. NIV53]